MNIIGKRYWFFGLSLAVIIPGLIALALGATRSSRSLDGPCDSLTSEPPACTRCVT